MPRPTAPASILALSLAFAGPAAAQGPAARWKHYRPGNTGIPGIQLHDGAIDPAGRIWVAGRWPFWGEGGYGVYDPRTDLWETFSNFDSPQPSQWARQIIFAPGGVTWMATDDGLVRKQGDAWTVYTAANSPLVGNIIANIALAPDGKLWINNRTALFSFDGESWTGPYTVGNQIPFAPPWYDLGVVLVTPDNVVWVSNETLNGIARFDGTSWTLRGQNIGRFGAGLVDQNGHLWLIAGVGGGNQFWRYRPQQNLWNQYGPGNTPFVNTTITHAAMDAKGAVYVGNWFGQVIRFDGTGWTQVADVGDAVYGISVDAAGDFWIVTLGNGRTGELHHVSAAGVPIRRYNTWNTGMPDYFVDRFDLDPQGNLWIATGEAGLSRFDGLRWRNWGDHNAGSEPYPFAGNEPMGCYYQDRHGNGWMGGNGIARWDPNAGVFTGFWNWQNNPGIGVTLFTSFAEGAAGNLFAADENGLTYRFDGALWRQQPTSPGSYTSNYAGVMADPQGRVWAMGWLRAFLWDGTTWTEVGQNWDIFNRGGINCYDIAADGTLWIATNEGLLRVQDPPHGPTTFYTTANSPLPAKQVQGIDIRQSDGAIAVSAHEFRSITPFPTGVAVISGDPDTPTNWTIYRYGQDPIPHYQLGAVKWDAGGNLWISAISEGAAVLLNSGPACYPNCDGSTTAPVLNVNDFICFQSAFAAGDPYANCDNSTTTPILNVNDFICFQAQFAAGCR